MRKQIVALAAVLALAAACTGGEGERRGSSGSPTLEPWRGGTLRIADWLVDGWLDPAIAWAGYGTGAELLRCCLTRTLISYLGVRAEDGGSEPRPDLAAGMPEVSTDGLTWTFRLKEGIRYGPPFADMEVVAQDIVRALERTADPDTGAVYATHFEMIEGYEAVLEGRASTISGLEVPEPHTLVVHLTEPAGDLVHRFSLPTTAPLPEGAADGHPNYGPFLVSTGPYMLDGSAALDFSQPPQEQAPAAGYTKEGFTFVRNPSWDPTSDPLRPAYVDRIVIVNHHLEWREAVRASEGFTEAYNDFYYDLQARSAGEVEDGTVDLSLSTIPSAEQVGRYRGDPLLADRLIGGSQDRLYFTAFNLAVPPFDDVHVRRAVSLALDKAGVVRLINEDPDWLGAVGANHIAPNGTEAFLLATYRPSWSSTDEPDPAAAREEMRRSAYDQDGDGRCDAETCRDVEVIVEETEEALHRWSAIMSEALETVGIHPRVRVLGYEGGLLEELLSPSAGWGTYFCIYCNWLATDFPGGSSVFIPMFYGPNITESWNYNVSLLGATSEQLRAWGYAVDGVPSVDERIKGCQRLVGAAQGPCWAELDQYLMEEVVPWIPLFFTEADFPVSERVASGSFDQRTGLPALDRIALVPGSD